MKKISLCFMFVLGLSWGTFAFAQSPEPDREVQVAINSVYIPSGFDRNSEVYVVIHGIFQNGCYKWKRSEVSHSSDLDHEVKAFASVTPGMCIMVLMPFQKEVRLGRFVPGDHKIRFVNGDGTYLEQDLKIQ